MARVTLSKENFFYNLDAIVKEAGDINRVALVLKDNAYGHGLLEIATLAQEYGIKRAVVQRDAEAQEIKELFDYILVLADTPQLPDAKVRYTINDASSIVNFPKNTKVELKVNTGMHRNGIEMDALRSSFALIQKQGLLLEAVFTHHGSADEVSEMYALQKKNFQRVKEEATLLANEFGFTKLRFHSANSATLFREQNFCEDMARVGIAAYGCMELPSALRSITLKPVLSLYASKISSRVLKRGDCVGYGATFQAHDAEVVTTYDVGYGDGFLRACSNNYVTPENIAIAGRISMDNSSFLSDKKEILIFNDAREVAKVAKTISYEVVTSLKPSMKREIV